MRKLHGLLLLLPLLLAGCVDLPGTIARNHTVKGELPPPIDPRLPPTPQTESQKSAGQTAASGPQRNFPAAAPKAHFTRPITEDQLTTENAPAGAEALRQELDQDEAFGSEQRSALPRGDTRKTPH